MPLSPAKGGVQTGVPLEHRGRLLVFDMAGTDAVNVRATAAGSATEVNGGTENDVVNISSDAPTSAGNLDGILGDICVNGDANAGGPSTT